LENDFSTTFVAVLGRVLWITWAEFSLFPLVEKTIFSSTAFRHKKGYEFIQVLNVFNKLTLSIVTIERNTFIEPLRS
jgi:hypothetical protein